MAKKRHKPTAFGKAINYSLFRYGPLQQGLVTGLGGSLLGRYLGAPLINAALPELPEEEEKERKRRIRRLMTFIGAVPGVLTALRWASLNWPHHGWKGLITGPRLKPEQNPRIDPAVVRKALSAVASTVAQALPIAVPGTPPIPAIPSIPGGAVKRSDYIGPGPSIPIGATKIMVADDPYLSISDKAQIINYLDEAAGGRERGLITKNDLMHAGMGAGIGWVGANLASKLLSSVFGLSPKTQSKLRSRGAIAGLLLGSGIVR